jgi:hypothetical protein
MNAALGFQQISRLIEADAMPGTPSVVTIAAILDAEHLMEPGTASASELAAAAAAESSEEFSILAAPDVSTRPASGRTSRRASRPPSVGDLSATDEGMMLGIADIPQPLSSRRGSRSSNRQLPADGPAPVVAAAVVTVAAAAATSAAEAAAPGEYLRAASANSRRASRTSARVSADQDGAAAAAAAGGAGEAAGAGLAGQLHAPGPGSRRTSRTLSGGWAGGWAWGAWVVVATAPPAPAAGTPSLPFPRRPHCSCSQRMCLAQRLLTGCSAACVL